MRAGIEHVFADMAPMGGKLIRTVGQGGADFAMIMIVAGYDPKRMVYFSRTGIADF